MTKYKDGFLILWYYKKQDLTHCQYMPGNLFPKDEKKMLFFF